MYKVILNIGGEIQEYLAKSYQLSQNSFSMTLSDGSVKVLPAEGLNGIKVKEVKE